MQSRSGPTERVFKLSSHEFGTDQTVDLQLFDRCDQATVTIAELLDSLESGADFTDHNRLIYIHEAITSLNSALPVAFLLLFGLPPDELNMPPHFQWQPKDIQDSTSTPLLSRLVCPVFERLQDNEQVIWTQIFGLLVKADANIDDLERLDEVKLAQGGQGQRLRNYSQLARGLAELRLVRQNQGQEAPDNDLDRQLFDACLLNKMRSPVRFFEDIISAISLGADPNCAVAPNEWSGEYLALVLALYDANIDHVMSLLMAGADMHKKWKNDNGQIENAIELVGSDHSWKIDKILVETLRLFSPSLGLDES